MSNFITSYPNCGSTIDWASCADNCRGTKDNPCINFSGTDDPCGVLQSGIGCFPKSCSNVCMPKNSRLKDLHIGI